MEFGNDESPKDLIGGSSYVYFLIHNLWTFLFGLSVVVFQLFLFWVLWDSAGERINEDFRGSSEWITGLVGASFMLLLRVWPNVGRGIELLCMGTGLTKRRVKELTRKEPTLLSRCEWRLMCVGLLDLTVSVACLFVGYRYSMNRSTSVLRTITTATVAVFIAGLCVGLCRRSVVLLLVQLPQSPLLADGISRPIVQIVLEHDCKIVLVFVQSIGRPQGLGARHDGLASWI